jgi:hypothetical protein
MRAFAYFCFIVWPALLWANMEVSLSPRQCQPGDVVALRVISNFETYTSFELTIPDRSDWLLLTHETGPVGLVAGTYQQEALVLFQPLRAGRFDFSDVGAVVRSTEGERTLALAIPLLEVQPYPSEEDSNELAELPEAVSAKRFVKGPWWLWLTGAAVSLSVGAAGVIWWIHLRKGARS